MRIALIHAMSGTRNGIDWPAVGTPFEVPDDEAELLVRIGMARPFGDEDERAEPDQGDVVAADATTVPADIPSEPGDVAAASAAPPAPVKGRKRS
jgi:hypothetical protein